MIFLYNFKYSIFEGSRFTEVARAANKRSLKSEIDQNRYCYISKQRSASNSGQWTTSLYQKTKCSVLMHLDAMYNNTIESWILLEN